MTTQELINKAKEGRTVILSSGREHTIYDATVDTEDGKVICDIESVQSRTSFAGWGRISFYIVKPNAKYRSRYSKAKALKNLG